jgi:Zn-finger nucleic acid-binding protein
MQEILSEGEPIDYCTGCRSAWLDKGEAHAFTAFPEKVLRGIATALLAPKRSAIGCPRCGGKMTEGGLFDPTLRLDRCDDCGGVFFDAKELSRLQKLSPAEFERPGTAAQQAVTEETTPAPAAATSPRCPACRTPVSRGDRWQCSCGTVWNAFDTQGRCPRCQRQWDETKCPRCGRWSERAAWYR